MGMFDFLKKKKKSNNTTENNLDLLEWQNIIQHDNSDILYMSREQLYSATIETYLPNVKRIIDDSSNLVNNTTELDVFFYRFDLFIKYTSELCKLEKFINFSEPLPSQQLDDIFKHKDDLFNQFIDIYWQKALESANKLKTKKGRENRLNKNYNELLDYKKYFSSSNFIYISSLIENGNKSSEKDYPFSLENMDLHDAMERIKKWSNGAKDNEIDERYNQHN